jgi:hypothetical protein
LYRKVDLRDKLPVLFACIAILLSAASGRSDDSRAESSAPSATRECDRDRSCATTNTSGSSAHQGGGSKHHSLFRSWFDMAERTQAGQPDWLSPLATTSGRLKNEFRYDVWGQPSPPGNTTYQFGGNKGLEFITSSRTQVLLGIPTYTLQSPKGPSGGFGDLPLMLKFRIASAPQREGNYLVTLLLSATAPTGSHRYGAGDAVLSPTLAFGKGWGRFDAQSTFGANLPAGDTARLGRQLQWNTAFQYAAAFKIWPELEVNSTFYETGKDAGDKQVFLTPGIGFGRIRLSRNLRFSSAAGMQIATTRFHTYNHRWMLSMRVSF